MRRLAPLLCLLAAAPAFATNYVHVLHTKRGKPVTPPPPTTPHLVYYGGKVIPNVKIIAVFWGPNVDPVTTRDIGAFYKDLVGGPAFDWLSEYDTAGVATVTGIPGSNQRIGRGTFSQAITITPRAQGNPLKDAQIKAELTSQIKAGKLPAPDANTLYMIHFPPKQKIMMTGLSCDAFCAYHGTLNQTTYYGVLPDQGKGSGCDVGCGNDGPFGNLTVSAAHEVTEAVTDAQVGAAGNKAGPPMAWYDAHKDPTNHEYAEIGDICSSYSADYKGPSGRTWKIQKEWSNKAGGCIATKGDAPVVASAANPNAGAKSPGAAAKPGVKGKAKPGATLPASTTTPKRRPMAG